MDVYQAPPGTSKHMKIIRKCYREYLRDYFNTNAVWHTDNTLPPSMLSKWRCGARGALLPLRGPRRVPHEVPPGVPRQGVLRAQRPPVGGEIGRTGATALLVLCFGWF